MGSLKNKQVVLDFVRQDELTNLVSSLLTNENEKRSTVLINGSFDPAELVECPRKLFYKATGAHRGETYFLQSTRFSIREKWLSYFDKCSRIRVAKKHIIATDHNYNISGYADAVIEIGEYLIVVAIKGVEASIYEDIKNQTARKKDIIELMVYSWLLEIKDGILIYENLNNQEYIIFHVTPYQPIIESIKKKCLDLFRMKSKLVEPEKPYKTKMSKECKKCQFNIKCWQERENA